MENTLYQQGYKVAAIDAPLEDRLAFLRKVYGLLSVSIFAAAAASYITLTTDAFLLAVYNHPILCLVAYIGSLIFVYSVRKSENLGMIALFVFTISSGVLITPLVNVYLSQDPSIVTEALALTGISFGGLSLYAVQTKKDLSFLGSFLVVGLITLIVASLLNVFVFQSPFFDMLIPVAGVLIFCGFILYDTQNILKNYPTDEHVLAALNLYVDVFLLFQYLLMLIGGSRD